MEPLGDSRRSPGRPFDQALTPIIMKAVIDELVEVGYSRLTSANVARRAQVSTATIYRRWSTKRELILAAAANAGATRMPNPATGTLAGDLAAFLEAKNRLLAGPTGGAIAALLGEVRHDAELQDVMRASLLQPTREGLEAIYEGALDRGEISDPVDAEAAAHVVVGTIMMAAVFRNPSGDSGPADGELTFSPAMVEQLVRALTPDS